MRSKNDHAGELLIDHTFSPGVTPEWGVAHGATGPIVGAGQKLEAAMKNCPHCGADVLRLHSREREWCWICDEYICERCGLLKKLGAPHKSMRELLYEIFNRHEKGVSRL